MSVDRQRCSGAAGKLSECKVVRLGFLVLSYALVCCTVAEDTLNGNLAELSDVEVYRSLFKHKHAEQVQAIKGILSLKEYAKQYKLANLTLNEIIQVIKKTKTTLENSNYVPGGVFPTDPTLKEALAVTVENAVLFCELALRLPDIVQRVLIRNNEGTILLFWSIGFTSETDLIDKPAQTLLNLASQELELLPRDPNFRNPYRKTEAEPVNETPDTPKKKRKKETRARGPQLSSGRTEL